MQPDRSGASCIGVSQMCSTGVTGVSPEGSGAGNRADTGGTAGEGEAALIGRCRTDRSAFAAVYRAHYGAIVGYLYRRTGDRHAAEDLASETFIAAMGSVHRFRLGEAPVRSWLYRIATNQANRWARTRKRRAITQRVSGLEPAAATAEVSDELARARAALMRLKASEQAVLALHYFEGLSVAEIARALGWREGTVKSTLSRGRDSLRRGLNLNSGSMRGEA